MISSPATTFENLGIGRAVAPTFAAFRFVPWGSPKTGHRGSLRNRPTITIIQDVDFDARAATLGRCEQCLERGTETANYRVGTVGLVAAEDSEDPRVWLLWNDAPGDGIKAALVLIDVELPVAIKIA